jgi:hypothetical protein
MRSLETITDKIEEELKIPVNIYWEQQRMDLNLFRNYELQNPAEIIDLYLRFITLNLAELQQKIPYRIKLGIFEINLFEVKNVLIKYTEKELEKFKEILPEIVEDRINFVNGWFNKYNEVIEG